MHQGVDSGLAAAVAGVTAVQEERDALGDSRARAAMATCFEPAHRLALEAAAGRDDPRLMAELLEVLRSQAMPVAIRQPAECGAPAAVVTLPPPPFVVMPWGTIACGPHLAYRQGIRRATAHLALGVADPE